MLCRVALLKDRTFGGTYHIIRVRRISELGTMLAVTTNCNTLRRKIITADVVPSSLIFLTLMMMMMIVSETSVLERTTWHHVPEYGILQSHGRENLKSYINP
jgi:hypothetical protein